MAETWRVATKHRAPCNLATASSSAPSNSPIPTARSCRSWSFQALCVSKLVVSCQSCLARDAVITRKSCRPLSRAQYAHQLVSSRGQMTCCAEPQPFHTRPSVPAALGQAEALVDHDLEEYVRSGPLAHACGIEEAIPADAQLLQELGMRLAKELKFDFNRLQDFQRVRIYHYYLPVYFWILEQLKQHKAAHSAGSLPSLMVGISAPQGCGKTTLVEELVHMLGWHGIRAFSVSIDDFYLTRQQQQSLIDSHPDNPLLHVRGNAGTHDLALGQDVLSCLKSTHDPHQQTKLPRYDKAAFSGRGDRAPESSWPVIDGCPDIVLFEGWMLGFRPVDDETLEGDGNVQEINKYLKSYKAAWDDLVDTWLVIRIEDPEWVYKWRLQAEHCMRDAGRPGMTDEEVQNFVSKYMPAYRAFLPGLYEYGPTTARPGHTLTVAVDQHRSPFKCQPQQPHL